MPEATTLQDVLTQLGSGGQQPTATSPTSRFVVSGENLRSAPSGIEAEWSEVKPTLREALKTAINAHRYPIYLFGDQGRGKTSAIWSLYRKINPAPSWVDMTRFIRGVQKARTSSDGMTYDFSDHGHSEERLFDRFVVQPELMLVDDIGIRAPSDSAFEIVYELVNRRRNRPAIYTSNIGPDKIHQVFDGRVASRLLCGTVIHLTGDDRRLKNIEVIEA